MKKVLFAKLFNLAEGQVLLFKTIDEQEQLPAFKVSTFDHKGHEFKTIYAFNTQIIRDESFEYYSQKHAQAFFKEAQSYFSVFTEAPQLPYSS